MGRVALQCFKLANRLKPDFLCIGFVGIMAAPGVKQKKKKVRLEIEPWRERSCRSLRANSAESLDNMLNIWCVP